MEDLCINDGFTLTDHLPAAPGLHPAAEIVYRPSLARDRLAHAARVESKDIDAIDRFECELVSRQVLTVNGARPTADQIRRLHPVVRDRLVALVLSYRAADEGNSSGVGDS